MVGLQKIVENLLYPIKKKIEHYSAERYLSKRKEILENKWDLGYDIHSIGGCE